MYTKQNFIDSVVNDARIIKHLAEKFSVENADFRPTPSQRSVEELLQYLSYVGSTTAGVILDGDMSVYGPASETAKSVIIENFATAMDTEVEKFKAVMEKFNDENLQGEVNMYGQGQKTRAVYLIDTILKWYAAYKLQLFMYLKMLGNDKIGTSNLWGGMDMPVK